jgi:hypothetical protein
LLLDMYVPTAKSAKNDHSLVKTIITNHVCIIQVATIYSAIFDLVIIYTLQVCRKFIIFSLCSQEENYFFHPCWQLVYKFGNVSSEILAGIDRSLLLLKCVWNEIFTSFFIVFLKSTVGVMKNDVYSVFISHLILKLSHFLHFKLWRHKFDLSRQKQESVISWW